MMMDKYLMQPHFIGEQKLAVAVIDNAWRDLISDPLKNPEHYNAAKWFDDPKSSFSFYADVVEQNPDALRETVHKAFVNYHKRKIKKND